MRRVCKSRISLFHFVWHHIRDPSATSSPPDCSLCARPSLLLIVHQLRSCNHHNRHHFTPSLASSPVRLHHTEHRDTRDRNLSTCPAETKSTLTSFGSSLRLVKALIHVSLPCLVPAYAASTHDEVLTYPPYLDFLTAPRHQGRSTAHAEADLAHI